MKVDIKTSFFLKELYLCQETYNAFYYYFSVSKNLIKVVVSLKLQEWAWVCFGRGNRGSGEP